MDDASATASTSRWAEALRRRRAPTARQVALDHIRDRILRGAFRPGTRLRQDEIADELGISRIPIREAAVELEFEGLLSHRANKGIYVRPITRQGILATYELRGQALAIMAQRAITISSQLKALTDELEAIVQRLKSNPDPSEIRLLSRLFDTLVGEACGAPPLQTFVDRSRGYEPADLYQSSPNHLLIALQGFQTRAHALRMRDIDLIMRSTKDHENAQGAFIADELSDRDVLVDDAGPAE